MTLEEKKKRLEELREAWKHAKTDGERKLIEIRVNMIKRTIHTLI